jgi:hypothetical protein
VSADSGTPDRVLWAMTYGLDGAMIGFLASGFFVTVLYYPYYWMNMSLAMALARVASTPATGAAIRTGQVRMMSQGAPRTPIMAHAHGAAAVPPAASAPQVRWQG